MKKSYARERNVRTVLALQPNHKPEPNPNSKEEEEGSYSRNNSKCDCSTALQPEAEALSGQLDHFLAPSFRITRGCDNGQSDACTDVGESEVHLSSSSTTTHTVENQVQMGSHLEQRISFLVWHRQAI